MQASMHASAGLLRESGLAAQSPAGAQNWHTPTASAPLPPDLRVNGPGHSRPDEDIAETPNARIVVSQGPPSTPSTSKQVNNIFSRKSSQGIVTGPRSCTFCSRTFVSQHALDIHLSRNMECRAMYRKSVTAARQTGSSPPPVSKDPVLPVERPDREFPPAQTAMDLCRDVLSAIVKMAVGPNLVSIQKELVSIMRKVEANHYQRVLEVKESVLQIWATSRRSGQDSKEYEEVKVLCKRFDDLFDRSMDNVRGLGGLADLGYLRHGPGWLGQQVKVYWQEEHACMEGVIDDHEQIDHDSHIYHIVYQDGNEQWTVLPHKNVELVGWISATDEKASGQTAALKKLGREMHKKCTLVAAREKLALKDTSNSLQNKLQARISRQEKIRKRPPAFIFNQPVELLEGSRYVKGIVTLVHASGSYDVYMPESGMREQMVPEGKIRARQTTKTSFDFLPLVQELRRKVQYDFYDEPVDDEVVQGYYHQNAEANRLSITAWNTQAMCFSWMEAKAQMQQYPCLSSVERDFNNIIQNAVTFNFANDIVNKEAVRLFHACKNIFSKWAKKTHIYCCMKCSDDHVPDDQNMQLILCDYCCEAIHTRCFYESAHARLLYDQEDTHPLRQDQSWFCSVGCYNDYQRISMHFQLNQSRPPLRQLQVEPLGQNGPASISEVTGQAPQRTAVLESRMNDKEPRDWGQGLKDKNLPTKRPVDECDRDGNQRPVSVQKRRESDSPNPGAPIHGVRQSLGLVQAMRASKNAERVLLEKLQTLQQNIQESLDSKNSNSNWDVITVIEDAVRTCSELTDTIKNGAVHTEKFLSSTGGATPGAAGSQQWQVKLHRLQGTSNALEQLLATKKAERTAATQCQATQLALHNALQADGEPPEELLEAAEKACEAFDSALRHSDAVMHKYLALAKQQT